MLALIGSTPLTARLAELLRVRSQVLHVPLPAGSNCEARLSAIRANVSKLSPLAIVAATGEDERSVLAAAIGKRLGAVKVASIVESLALAGDHGLARALDIDHFVHPESAICSAIVQFAQGPIAATVQALAGGKIRAADLVITAGWKGNGVCLRDLGLPKGTRIALVMRADGRERLTVPTAATTLSEGDRVLLVANAAVADEAVARFDGAIGRAAGVTIICDRSQSERGNALAHALHAAGMVAHLSRPGAAPSPRGDAETIVVLEPSSGSAAAVEQALASGAGVCRVRMDLDSPDEACVSADARDLQYRLGPGEAVAQAIASMWPRSLERVGTIIPGHLAVYRVEAAPGGTWIGSPLRDTPALRGWTVLAIQAGRGSHLPHPDDVIQPGEVLVVAGPPTAETALVRGLRGG